MDTTEELEVIVPEGCKSGSEIIVSAGARELTVTVPEGVGPGDMIIVDLPPTSQPSTPSRASSRGSIAPCEAGETVLVAVVPDGATGGSEIFVDTGDRELCVVVPLGLRAGDEMEVVVPPLLPPSPRSPAPIQKGPPPSQLQPTPSPPAPKRVQPPELSDDSDTDDSAVGAKFGVGSPVELLRTDGNWTLATVSEYDELGGHYTITLTDGRSKYFVEEGDLRIPRFLLLSTANI